MIDLSVRGLVKGFEQGNDILKGITFDVNAGERVGILGRNGCGKTTFFRILSGELQPDAGTVSIASGRRLGLISQIPVYPDGWTTEDVLREAHRRLYDMEARMNELTARMATDHSPALLSEYDRLSENFRRLGGYDMEHERNRVANGLDIPAAMRAQPFDSLSGGEKTRVNLARLILEDTDILLLDEPTNHLDLRATEWLEAYLLHFRGTVLVISHDRYFLDRVVQRSIDFTSGQAEFYSGNYSFYVVERQRRFDEQLKKYEKDQAKLQQLTEAAAKLHLWAFMGNDKLHKRAFSIEKRMEKLETTERPTEARKLNVHFTAQEFRGDDVLTMSGLGKRYGERTLFHDLDLTVTGGERIALIGDNGTGKSTLIKMIVGELYPDDGRIKTGPQVKEAYLPQIIRFDHPDWNLVENMMAAKKGLSAQSARNRLAAYDFRGEDVFKPVSVLSGGEQSRLRLCMLMDDEINFLILDEPTNHLDIDSREWIEEAVEAYDGTLLFVSHDRYFINRFATRIWELADGTITDYPCGFAQYRQMKAQEEAEKAAAPKPEKEREKPAAERPQRGNKAQQAARRQLTICERDIARAEERIAALEADMEAAACDYEKLNELVGQKDAAQAELDALYERWEQLSEEAEG